MYARLRAEPQQGSHRQKGSRGRRRNVTTKGGISEKFENSREIREIK